MTEKLLDGADVIAGLEQMGRERVAKRVRCGGFSDAGGAKRLTQRALERLVA